MRVAQRALLTLGVGAALLFAACGDTERTYVLGGGGDAGSAAPPPTPSIDVSDAAPAPNDPIAPNVPPPGRCVATECVYPAGSCTDRNGLLPTYECGTDLANDADNCGACGNVCDQGLAMKIVCSEGRCRNAGCNDDYANCNDIVDDGCEVYLREDDAHCGACGNACPEGTRCLNSFCGGCPPGSVTCGNDGCVSLDSSNQHCGACGYACADHQPSTPVPPHMMYSCNAGSCSELRCVEDDSGKWADCNGDVTDGCEVNVLSVDPVLGAPFYDPSHCAACGNTCAADQRCFDDVTTLTDTSVACRCGGGLSVCDRQCADVQNDPFHCGACNNNCAAGAALGPTMIPICDKGRCGATCAAGLSDCNQNVVDGCEADVLHDPRNCGGCGIACDVAAGQPCVNGECLTQACGGPQ